MNEYIYMTRYWCYVIPCLDCYASAAAAAVFLHRMAIIDELRRQSWNEYNTTKKGEKNEAMTKSLGARMFRRYWMFAVRVIGAT